ncbi:hypothetical protein JoomaDRAFT_1388 [Galbibacter orientalis DSM 19592]|uniref:Outer membrane protein beta-barrel domain-containing protein n=1 Tax=Galbibacter orientalis DSM 19592 TaxID=926559 RepID=I3C460_9FLAO|nr:outer membrane beta-barrel protein [Galbibacter orientalis]EIJ38403.1 hypothetical protein JoomaDRAFT_1388 [Galbibacter orientalis DSM 19592]
MNDKKNIERLFQEKFKDFDTAPPENMWERIDASLDKKAKQDRKVIPIWWKLGGAAAAIALLILFGDLFFNSSENTLPNSNIITNTEQETNKENGKNTLDENSIIKTNDAVANSANKTSEEKLTNSEGNNPKTAITNTNSGIAVQNSSDGNTAIRNPKKPDEEANLVKNNLVANTTPESKSESEQNTVNKNIIEKQSIAENNTEDESPSEKKDNNEKKSLLDVVAEMEKEKELVAVKEPKNSRWTVNPNVAPVYYNSLSKGSPINSEFSSNAKEGVINMSYGINVAYNVSKRLSVRSGINNVNMGYSTNDVNFGPAVFGASQSLSTIDFKSSETSLNVSSSDKSPSFSPNSNSQFEAKTENVSEGSMKQEFGYIEVPMELKYRLVDKRFGINIIGGMSSLFLTSNEVSIQSSSLTTEVGEANNLNGLSFSTNIGVGLDYQLSNKLLFNLEPMFKYQLNTFSREDGGFSPYILGVYTGLSFKF